MIPTGLLWNEAELPENDPVQSGLVSLAVFSKGQVHLIGTAFIVVAQGAQAAAISAAHCFNEVHRLVHPNESHNATTPREFLPPPPETDLSNVMAWYKKGETSYPCAVTISVWDAESDIAILTLVAPDGRKDLFENYFFLSPDVPEVGDPVALFGFGEMGVISVDGQPGYFRMQRKLVARVGVIEECHPTGNILLRSPCVSTTVPVYFGMSGGVVARFTEEGSSIKPFGFISFAPEPQPLLDQSQSGHSTVAVLPMKIINADETKQEVSIWVENVRVGRREKL